jgi:hypothetical protein
MEKVEPDLKIQRKLRVDVAFKDVRSGVWKPMKDEYTTGSKDEKFCLFLSVT